MENKERAAPAITRGYPQGFNIPPELVYKIFDIAAQLSTSFSLTLSLVSTWTRRLALPHLYSTLVIEKLSTLSLLQTSLHAEFYHLNFNPRPSVRSMWIKPNSNGILRIFQDCDNLTHLALHIENFLWLVYASSPLRPRLSILPKKAFQNKKNFELLIFAVKRPDWSLASYTQEGPSNISPMFDRITHLRLDDIGDYRTFLDVDHFTSLTHIAIPWYNPTKHPLTELNRILALPKITCLVILIYTDFVSSHEVGVVHEWVKSRNLSSIFVIETRMSLVQEEWEEEVRGGLSIWAKAARYNAKYLS